MMISVVIPCYNSEKTIKDVVTRTECTLESDGRFDYEIICVNDYSIDGTFKELTKIADKDSKVKVLDLSKNFGQHAALMAGFNFVSGDMIVSMDDDGQSKPEDLISFIEKLIEGYDIVSARYVKEKRSLYRRMGSHLAMAMSRSLIGMPKDIELNSYCIFRRFVADEIVKYKNPYPFVHGLMLRVTRNIANVNLERPNRESGKSGYSFKKLLDLWMNGFTAFSVKPLRIATILGVIGILLCLISIILSVFFGQMLDIVLLTKMNELIVLFAGSLMLLAIGLLGEYVGRIYISINEAPQYVIKRSINI